MGKRGRGEGGDVEYINFYKHMHRSLTDKKKQNSTTNIYRDANCDCKIREYWFLLIFFILLSPGKLYEREERIEEERKAEQTKTTVEPITIVAVITLACSVPDYEWACCSSYISWH